MSPEYAMPVRYGHLCPRSHCAVNLLGNPSSYVHHILLLDILFLITLNHVNLFYFTQSKLNINPGGVITLCPVYK